MAARLTMSAPMDPPTFILTNLFYVQSHENIKDSFYDIIGEGLIMSPTVPVSIIISTDPTVTYYIQGSSDRERLLAHAEVLALRERLGISYKDAAHRLYMAEVERLKADEKLHKGFANFKISTEEALERAYISIREIEK